MNREPDFELSADMRLLDLQRSALGLSAPQRPAWETRLSSEPPLGVALLETASSETPVIVVELSASPSRDVIAGAVVTLALSVANDGAADAKNIRISVPRPAASIYRPGTLLRDGRTGDDALAEDLFGMGVEIAHLSSKTRTTFVWKLSVGLGTKALFVAPHVRAEVGAIIGARPISISRKATSTALFAAELTRADAAFNEAKPLVPVVIPVDELPIYELDEEEQLVYEAADSALAPATAPSAVLQPQVSLEQLPEPEAQSASEPAPREAIVLFGTFEPATLAFFERVFNGSKPATILQHCIFGSAIACPMDGFAGDKAGIKAHLAAQSQVLHRIALHEKLGKKEPIAEYAGQLTADLTALRPAPIREPERTAGSVILSTELSEPTMAVIRRIAEDRARWDFVKARQLTLALQAQSVCVENPAGGAAIQNALRAYGQSSMTALQRLFVRMRVDRTTGLLSQTEPALDAAARTLLAALSSAMPR
jgi:hypothetical protein